jgi:2-oxopent-4-enoate/cis-2-oxohex-4-enoate hydratase
VTATIDIIERCARLLFDAEQTGAKIDPLTATFLDLTLEDAYAIQAEIAALRQAAGIGQIGWKTAFTNPLLRERFNAPEPTRGYLASTAPLSTPEVHGGAYLVEPEMTFYLEAEVRGPGVTAEQVLSATRGVAASFEVAAPRYNQQVSLVDLTADNAGATYLIASAQVFDPRSLGDLAEIGVEVRKNGEVVQTGKGAEVMGGPASAMAWLANQLAPFGLALEKGQTVLSGSLTLPTPVMAGDKVTATFDQLGTVQVSVAP